eukprot:gene1157-16073_t
MRRRRAVAAAWRTAAVRDTRRYGTVLSSNDSARRAGRRGARWHTAPAACR